MEKIWCRFISKTTICLLLYRYHLLYRIYYHYYTSSLLYIITTTVTVDVSLWKSYMVFHVYLLCGKILGGGVGACCSQRGGGKKKKKTSNTSNLLHLNPTWKTKDSPDSARCRSTVRGQKPVLSAQGKVCGSPRARCQSRWGAADRVNWSVMQHAHFSGRPTGCAKGSLRTAMPFTRIATTFRSHFVSLRGFVQNTFSTYWKVHRRRWVLTPKE